VHFSIIEQEKIHTKQQGVCYFFFRFFFNYYSTLFW